MDKQKQAVGRYSEEELAIIRSTFKGNDKLLKLVRKIFLPEITAQNLTEIPIGAMIDVYSSISPDRNPEDVKIDVSARNLLLSHLNVQLNSLMILANQEDETPDERASRLKKDSTK